MKGKEESEMDYVKMKSGWKLDDYFFKFSEMIAQWFSKHTILYDDQYQLIGKYFAI